MIAAGTVLLVVNALRLRTRGMPLERGSEDVRPAPVPGEGRNIKDGSSPTSVKASARLQACVDALSNQSNKGMVAVTSITSPAARHFRERGWRDTLWGGPSLAAVPPLIVYHEDAWDVAHGRARLDPALFPDLPNGVCYFDVFDAAPALMASVTAADGMYEEFYALPHTLSLSDEIMDGKALVRKLVSIAHAARHLADGAVLLWLDVDTGVRAPLDDDGGAFATLVRSRDATYIAETDCGAAITDRVRTLGDLAAINPLCLDFRLETGVFALNMGPAARALIGRAQELYDGDMLRIARACLGTGRANGTMPWTQGTCARPWVRHALGLNDIYVFAMALHDMDPAFRHGWFADNPPPGCDDRPSSAKTPGMCNPCVAATPGALASAFRLGEFVTHYHRGAGIMASQHSVDEHYGARKEHKPRDAEMVHVGAWYPSGSHVDPRCACFDEHARWTEPAELDVRGKRQCERDPNTGDFLRPGAE